MGRPPSAPPGSGGSSTYLPGLDGLRGVAVLLVVAFHASVPGFGGGFLGVEVFFVISGFLITGILLREIEENGRLDLKNFYIRRALRLLPALVLCLVVLMGVWTVVGEWEELRHTSTGALYVIFYSVNWARSYGWGDTGLLSHTWSLSIEEQFYIAWPFCLLLMLRGLGPRKTAVSIALLTGLVYLSNFLRIDDTRWTALYLGTWSRAGGLLCGASLAAWAWRDPTRVRGLASRYAWLAAPGAALLLAVLQLHFAASDPWLYKIGLPLCGVASSVLIATLSWNESYWFCRLFRLRPLRWIGKRSYGLYLWHYPVFILMTPSPWWARISLGAGLAIGIAAVSYHFIEKPYLLRKRAFRAGLKLEELPQTVPSTA